MRFQQAVVIILLFFFADNLEAQRHFRFVAEGTTGIVNTQFSSDEVQLGFYGYGIGVRMGDDKVFFAPNFAYQSMSLDTSSIALFDEGPSIGIVQLPLRVGYYIEGNYGSRFRIPIQLGAIPQYISTLDDNLQDLVIDDFHRVTFSMDARLGVDLLFAHLGVGYTWSLSDFTNLTDYQNQALQLYFSIVL